MDKLKEEFIKLKCTTNVAGEPILACTHIDFAWGWFSEKLKAEQEKSASFEQQLNDVINAYKIDVTDQRRQAFDDAISRLRTFASNAAIHPSLEENEWQKLTACGALNKAIEQLQTERDKNGTL